MSNPCEARMRRIDQNTWSKSIQESKAILHTYSPLHAEEAGAALGPEQDAHLSDMEESDAEEMADFEESHAPRMPRVKTIRSCRSAADRMPTTPPPKKPRTLETRAGEQAETHVTQA